MSKNTIVSRSYNLAVEVGFNSFLEEHATKENSEIKVDEQKLISQIENEWLSQELAEIGNITPNEYIKSLVSLGELVELFIEIASISDVGVPDIIIHRLKEYGKPAADMLFSFVETSLSSPDNIESLAISQAVFAIGCLRCDEYKEKLIELLIECSNDEIISEAVCAAITEYADTILADLIKNFDATDQALVQEHILICIAEISKEYKSDEVFYFLKNAFSVVSNSDIIVEVLGDYGDGRAIPLLRGYIIKNTKEMDKATFNHIRAVIKKLGGEINDLSY